MGANSPHVFVNIIMESTRKQSLVFIDTCFKNASLVFKSTGNCLSFKYAKLLISFR